MKENKSIRIRTTVNQDKFITLNLTNNFDTLDILSLKIRQEDVFRDMCSDYGMVCGRVSTKDFGIPNARVSIFIPLTDEDEDNQLITSLYPFKRVTDKTEDGIRYNLLSKEKQKGFHQPVGTFPPKREVLDNDIVLEIYEKYYKFTTTTNDSGDYMIFGIPIGNHTIHMDIDFSDIGFVSSRPHELIAKGYPEKLFENNNTFRRSSNLDELAQIVSQNKSVSILPFWGDLEQCEVGITRVDFDIQNFDITPSAIFFGSMFADKNWNFIDRDGNVTRNHFWDETYCDMINDHGSGKVETIIKSEDGDNIEFLEPNIFENNSWAFSIPMNKTRVITDEFGNLTPSPDPTRGVPTEVDVRFKIGFDRPASNGDVSYAKYLVPNIRDDAGGDNYNFGNDTNDDDFFTMKWKRLYSVRQFMARYQRITNNRILDYIGFHRVDGCPFSLDFPFNRTNIVSTGIQKFGSRRFAYHSEYPLHPDPVESFSTQFDKITDVEHKTSYDFYNSWINGSLYSFGFKTANKVTDFSNNDRNIYLNYVLDTTGFTENLVAPADSVNTFDQGLIKKKIVDGGIELFYASQGTCNNLLYATNITDLGSSIKNKDEFGIPDVPFLFDKLPKTSFTLPINIEKKIIDNSPPEPLVINHDLITRTCEIGSNITIDPTSLIVTETIDVELRKTLCELNKTKNPCDNSELGNYTPPVLNLDGTLQIPDNCDHIERKFNVNRSKSLFSYYFYFGLDESNSLSLVKQKFFT
ncbi:hypothetical protein COB55_06000 [Candidatus Wolfebacteria bacterium]|nr:MAG: hypothetical protein COB55_06000 [Candidatus Wolfebacteria bacterium]